MRGGQRAGQVVGQISCAQPTRDFLSDFISNPSRSRAGVRVASPVVVGSRRAGVAAETGTLARGERGSDLYALRVEREFTAECLPGERGKRCGGAEAKRSTCLSERTLVSAVSLRAPRERLRLAS